MKDRTNQGGQALIYTGVLSLAFFALAAIAVDAGRHVFVGRETQAVADATALAGATALARRGDAVSAATGFASQNTVDGQAASIGSSDVQVGSWNGSTFAPGGSPPNAVRTAPSFTFHNIFGLWSPTSAINRRAVAAFQGAPQLPIVLCGTVPWTSSVTIRFSTSNGGADANTAAWAVYDPQATGSFPGAGVVRQYLPPGCGGTGWVPSPQTVGQSVSISNGSLNTLCQGLTQPSCNLIGKTYLFPIVDVACYGALNGAHKITGFVGVKIASLPTDCSSGWSLTGQATDDCATAPSARTCPSAGLVE